MADKSSNGRVPPHDIDAEKALISAALIDSNRFDEVVDIIDPSDFYSGAHKTIWESICQLDIENVKVDTVTVSQKLRELDKLQQVGGATYLMELTDAAPTLGHETDHARIVADLARQRRIVAVCQVAVAEGYSPQDVEAYAQKVADNIYRATDVGSNRDKPETLMELIPPAFKEIGLRGRGEYTNIPYIFPGFITLGNKLGGGWTNNMYVIAGRPGMGKTAFALSCLVKAAALQRSVVFISAEMPKEQLAFRLLAQESGINYETLYKGSVVPHDWSRLTEAAAKLAKLPMSICYRPGATIPEIRSIIRRETARLCKRPEVKKGLATIDYLQILNGQRREGDSRDSEVGEMSRSIMAMTGQFGMPILALSQLNRNVESRPNKRPLLSDLRESGSIEQDAYAVLLMYRDDYYNKASSDKGIVEIDVAKHRNGTTGSLKLRFLAESMGFTEEGMQSEFDDYHDNR